VSLSLKSAHEWRISTRTRGEVLAASARSGACRFLVLGVPGRQTIPDVEAWLVDLLGVAAESTRTDKLPRPIPAHLHHALAALLFSHREVWNASPPGSTFSMAFVEAGEEAGFGWVGLGHPRVWIDDEPVEVQWVRVRDLDGREAYAMAVKAGARARVSLDWKPSSAPRGEAVVEVEAVLGAPDGEAAPVLDDEHDAAPFTIAEVVGPLAAAPAAAPEPAPTPAAPPAQVEPAPEPAPVATKTAAAPAPAAARTHAASEIPELIPPSPEPPDLTARAIQSQATGAATEALRSEAADRAPAPEVLEGATLAPPVRPRPRMRPAWPSEQELKRSRRRGVPAWVWNAVGAVLVAVAWAAGLIPGTKPAAPNPVLALFGLGGARFHLSVESRPEGAWISADGKDLVVRTPATVELAAGEHQIALSFPDLGSASFTVRGARGDHQSLSTPMWGSLTVRESDAAVPVAVELDGAQIGYAPVTVDSVTPGAHELRFSGPGLTPWGQALRCGWAR
jgi:hypothetical protein